MTLRICFYLTRASANQNHAAKIQFPDPGELGQHVNKVSTAVEITHAPSGTTVHCSDSRSQHTNRALALLRLVEKIESQRAAARQERKAELSKRRRQRAKRSYGTKQEMLRDKRHRGETKKLRGRVAD